MHLMASLEDDIATTESVASDMTVLGDLEIQGEVPVSREHDQLPSSVEEYMAQQTPTKVLGTMEIDQAGNVHDQLPNIEDYKLDHGGIQSISSGKNTLRYLGIALVVLAAMVAIIVVPVVLVKNGSPSRESRIPAVADYLEALHISEMADMSLEGSPQNRALKWIADDDDYQMALPNITSADSSSGVRQLHHEAHSTRNPFVERYSLAVFYYSLGGPKWDYQLRFLSPTHHCEWYRNFRTVYGSDVRFGVNDCKEVDGVNYVSEIGARKSIYKQTQAWGSSKDENGRGRRISHSFLTFFFFGL